MDIIASKDIIDFLGIRNVLITYDDLEQLCVIVTFSEKDLLCIIPDRSLERVKTSSCYLRIKTDSEYICLPIRFDAVLNTKRYTLVRFLFDKDCLPTTFQQKTSRLFLVTRIKQQRKEERIQVDSSSIKALSLRTSEICIYAYASAPAVLKDVSFSGARFFCDADFSITTGSKCVLTFSFTDPEETVSVMAEVLRKNLISISRDYVADIAVKFSEPVIYNFSDRIGKYYNERQMALKTNRRKENTYPS